MTVTLLAPLIILQNVRMTLDHVIVMKAKATLVPDVICVLMAGSFNLMALAEVNLPTAMWVLTGIQQLVHAQAVIAICQAQSEALLTVWMKVESAHVMTVQATWETNAMSVLMVGILLLLTAPVQVRLFLR